ncbi:MAG: hypothetical protein IJ374_11910 [Lachnospiraceae bacterium]|nr:hypothetical protein [Lachnospiraceae bacterium]
MKKMDKMVLGIYIIIGIVLILIGATSKMEYYSTMIFAMGFGLTGNSMMQFIRYYHNTKPENIALYQEKLRKQTIDLKDERNIQLRNRAGYLTWAITMGGCFVGAFIAALFRLGTMSILLVGAATVQYLVAAAAYKYLCKNT